MVKTLLELVGLFTLNGRDIPSREPYNVRFPSTIIPTIYARRTDAYLSDCECDCDCQGTDCSGGDGSDCECTSDW